MFSFILPKVLRKALLSYHVAFGACSIKHCSFLTNFCNEEGGVCVG